MTTTPEAGVVDVVVCCYTELRWDEITVGVRAAGRQSHEPRRVVVVVDHNAALHERLVAEFGDDDRVDVIVNAREKGLSGARNTAVEHSDAELLAFLDDDACPSDDWLKALVAPFAEDDVWVTGGHVSPRWPSVRPSWFPPEFDWVVGCTYRGMPLTLSDVRNVHGASMVFRRAAFDRIGLFVEGVGRVDTIPKGCEETELCIRIQQGIPQARVVYVPESDVSHMVSEVRVEPSYFRSRCWAEGLSKAAISALVQDNAATSTELDYVKVTLRGALTDNVARAARGDRAAARRAVMILTGFVWTAAGYVTGRAGQLLRSVRLSPTSSR